MSTTICYDRDFQGFEVPTHELRFSPSVYAVIVRDKSILLIPQHGDGYGLPWGRIELGESIEAALSREVKEETGYDIRMESILDCQDSFFRTNTSKNFLHSILIFSRASIIWGDLSDAWFEESERLWMKKAEWVDISTIEALKFYGSRDILKIIQKHTFFHK